MATGQKFRSGPPAKSKPKFSAACLHLIVVAFGRCRRCGDSRFTAAAAHILLWLHEIKHDGFRIIARKDGERVRLYSRPGNDFTPTSPGARLMAYRSFGVILADIIQASRLDAAMIFPVNKIPISTVIEGRGAQEMVALVLRRRIGPDFAHCTLITGGNRRWTC